MKWKTLILLIIENGPDWITVLIDNGRELFGRFITGKKRFEYDKRNDFLDEINKACISLEECGRMIGDENRKSEIIDCICDLKESIYKIYYIYKKNDDVLREYEWTVSNVLYANWKKLEVEWVDYSKKEKPYIDGKINWEDMDISEGGKVRNLYEKTKDDEIKGEKGPLNQLKEDVRDSIPPRYRRISKGEESS